MKRIKEISAVLAVLATVIVLIFGIISVWADFSTETNWDVVLTWYLSMVLFAFTGLIAMCLED